MTTPAFSWDSIVNKSILCVYDSATGLPKYMDETGALFSVDVTDRDARILGRTKIHDGTNVLDVLIQDSAFGAAAKGLAIFGKYQVTPTAYTDGDAAPILLDANGRISLSSDIQIGAVELKDADTDGRANIKAANTARTTGTLVIATQPIDAAGTVLSTSALATAAKQDTLDASVNTLLKPANTLAGVTTVATVTNLAQQGGVAIALNTGVRDTGTQRVTIATNDLVPISAASLPLPSGAATETTLAALNTKVTTKDLDSGAGTDNRQVVGLVTAGSGGAADVPLPVALTAAGGVKVGVVDALPTGTNNIGDVDVLSSALPTGAATETTVAGVKTGTDKIPAQGQALMAASTPVAIASNQSAVPVSGTVTANLGTIADVATQTTLALVKAKTDNLDSLLSLSAREATQLLQPLAATTPVIYNVTMTNANTEYSQALPAGTKILEFREQSLGFITRYAFETGKVAGSVSPFRTLDAGEVKTVEGLNLTSKTLFFACSTAAKVLEIEVWT